MRQFTSDELRKTWKQFYIDRGHVDVGAVSLVSDGSTGVLFNVAGMQPLMPYLLGQKHPLGTRAVTLACWSISFRNLSILSLALLVTTRKFLEVTIIFVCPVLRIAL